MALEYAERLSAPGCILKPGDTTSQRFTPQGYFLLMVSGAMTGNIRVYGIPVAILEDSDIPDKSSYWTELESGLEITNSSKTAGFFCPRGVVCELRASVGDSARYVLWDYMERGS